MKKVLIAAAVFATLGVVAQRGKVNTEIEKGNMEVQDANTKPVKTSTKGAGDVKMTDGISKPKEAVKPKSGAAPKKDVMSAKEVGMQRVEAAKAKYSEPKTAEEADGMIAMAMESTMKTIAGTEGKLASAETMIEQMHDSGEMSDMAYELNMAKLDAFKARSESISGQMK